MLEAITERERRPARCIDCGSTDLLDPLDELDSDGEVQWLCDHCHREREES
ncbi:hypothetical protein C439_10510 [Haloferax mediterranei ATCC 33500]|uniref:Uncharacterized protein n=1 Tax=Haloferax mediterranei (strain ATCC 33500 / DSM 1411 / JCM 8866 / NBRC 14739 / NCIMB 2177 / R-4) TaxID=523841 RepID=I3R8W1_HALMT|nr:hypothetical protein HFX_3007 [Haloferax mediterranei ATCC 33500]EMA03009.1 hypothetical protein C439_10510 [Haloferax mediterranei ATCC 33500]